MRYHLSPAARPPPAFSPAACLPSVVGGFPVLGLGRLRASVWGLALVGSCPSGCCLCVPVPLLPLLPCVVCLPFPSFAGASCPHVPFLQRRPSRAARCAWTMQRTG